MTTYRLVAPRHYAPGHTIALSGGEITIPAGGIVEIEDTWVNYGRNLQTIEGVDSPDRLIRHRHLRELLALGFTHAPAAGGVTDRPAGRYDGEPWFDTYTGKPLWWSNGAGRDALGKLA